MSEVHLRDPYRVRARTRLPSTAARDLVLAELASRVLVSLPRSDQRRKGTQYLNGLLEVEGRKSIRNMAKQLGDHVSEQNLHHFICDSTWDWVPLRRELAKTVAGTAPVRAWVVKPTVIPKAGQHSVGVVRHFSQAVGQTLNAQRAVGVWAACDGMDVPVNWRLHLPPTRPPAVSDGGPAGPAPTLDECAADAARETALGWGLPVRPTVLDLDEVRAPLLERLAATSVPLLVRIGGGTRLTVLDPALPVRDRNALTARQVMSLAEPMRRPVLPVRPGSGGRGLLAAAVHVGIPPGTARPAGGIPAPRSGRRPLVLLGLGEEGGHRPAELWLSNLTTLPVHHLAGLRELARGVDRRAEAMADRVGLRDFTGRSFNGWNRHVTLASIAHTVMELTRTARRPPLPAP